MSRRSRALPVLIVLFLLIGADALLVLHRSYSATLPEPVIVHHQKLSTGDRYSGEVRLPNCAALRSGIDAKGQNVSLDFSVDPSEGSCSASSSQSFAVLYGSEAQPIFTGVLVDGMPASYELVEDAQ